MVPPVTPVAREFPAMMANQYGSAIQIMFTCVLPPIITAGAFGIIQRQHQRLSMNPVGWPYTIPPHLFRSCGTAIRRENCWN